MYIYPVMNLDSFIEGESQKTVFDSNVAGNRGGAVSIKILPIIIEKYYY
jgi:predicted outer membrane repeat protein